MVIRVAAVQPRSFSGAEEERNVGEALGWLDQAAQAGAELVVFPEGYPGPANPANRFDAAAPLAQRAAQRGLHVVAGWIEPAPGGGSYVALHLIDDQGVVAGGYRRTSPPGPYVYHDLDIWQADYVESPVPPAPVRTRLGSIGMLVCSEVYVPELSRLHAVAGADLIVYPAGGAINELLPGWRTLLWARAVENLVFTVACQNIYTPGEEGVAQIAAPERVLAAATGPGMLIADLDLDRLTYLRSQDAKIEFPRRYSTIPGMMRWRRPELYADLAATPALTGT